MKTTTPIECLTETQKFYVGEVVAFVDANNRLRYAEVAEPEDDLADDRIALRDSSGSVARPHRSRVAHLFS
jgi:hypothetical protein